MTVFSTLDNVLIITHQSIFTLQKKKNMTKFLKVSRDFQWIFFMKTCFAWAERKVIIIHCLTLTPVWKSFKGMNLGFFYGFVVFFLVSTQYRKIYWPYAFYIWLHRLGQFFVVPCVFPKLLRLHVVWQLCAQIGRTFHFLKPNQF